MIKRLLCVVWVLPFLYSIAECQQCRICGPEQEGGSCQPNKIMDVPDNITISDGMCTAIESTGYHTDVLCEEYKAPKGYVFECVTSTNSQFSCRSTCGPSLDSIGTGPEFDLLNQNGGLLLGKGANKRGLLDFSNFQNGGGFDFGLGNTFGQGNVNPRVQSQDSRGSGVSASGSESNKESRQKSSSNIGNGDQNLFTKDLFADLGFNSFYPTKKQQSPLSNNNANIQNSKSQFGADDESNQDNPDIRSGTEPSRPGPLEVSLIKERDTDENIVVPIAPQVQSSKSANPEKVKLVKIPNLDLKVNPSNLVVEPEKEKKTTTSSNGDTESASPNQRQPAQQEELPNSPVPNDPYSRYPKPRSQNPLPDQPPPTESKTQGIAVGEPYGNDEPTRQDPPPPLPRSPPPETRPPPYKPPQLNDRSDDFDRQKPPPPPPTQRRYPNPNVDGNNRHPDSTNPKLEYPRPNNYPAPPQISSPSSSNNLPPTNNNQPRYPPSQLPPQNQPPRRLPTYLNPTINPSDSSTSRDTNLRIPSSQIPQRKFNNPPPQGSPIPNTNQRNSYPNPRDSINTLPANRQPNTQRQYPYNNNNNDNNNNNNNANRYDDRYPNPPQYSNSNSNTGRGNSGLGDSSTGVKAPQGLDGSRLSGDDGGLGKSVDFAGTSLLTDSDYLDKSSDGNRYKNKVPEEFEKPFQAENDIFPGFSNFANGDKAGFGTGKSVFNLFDGKDSEPPGFKNGQFNFNNKDFLKPDSYNKDNNGGGNRGNNPSSPTSNPNSYGPGSQPARPGDSYNSRPSSPDNRSPYSFRPTYQPSPQPSPVNPVYKPSPRDTSRYPPDNSRNDLIRQNERRNPTTFDPSSSPTSNRSPFLTAPNQNNPNSNNARNPYPSQSNNYRPNNVNEQPRGQSQPPRNYPPSAPSRPRNDQYPSPQRQEDNSPPFNTNLRSPLNLFGGSLPFQNNPDSRPANPGANNAPKPDYRNPQQSGPQAPDFQGGNPYSNQPPANYPYPSRNSAGFQGSNNFPQPSGFGGPRENRPQPQPPFQQQSPQPPPSQSPQPANGQFDFQNPGISFQPGNFPPIFDRNSNGNTNDKNNNNFGPNPGPPGPNRFTPPNPGPPGQDRFAPPGQPSSSNQFPISGGRDENSVPNVHINNFLSSQPNSKPYDNPQGVAAPSPYSNNRPGPPGPPSNASPFPGFFNGNNQQPAYERGNPITPYDVRSPQQSEAGRQNFQLDFKPIGQPGPGALFSQPSQNRGPPSQPSQQPSPYSGPPSNDRGSGNPFSFGGLGSPPRPAAPSYEPNRSDNDRVGTPFSFDGPPRGASSPSYNQPPSTNDRIGRTPFSFDGPGRGPPPPSPQNQPQGGDTIGRNPFSFGNRNPNGPPPPSAQDPPRSPIGGSPDPFSFGNNGRPSQSFTPPSRPSTNRGDGNPFSFGSSDRPSQAPSPFNQAPPPRANINPPNQLGPGYSAPPGNRYDSPYNPNQGGLPRAPFQQGGALVDNNPQSRPSARGDNGALLDSSPFSFEDPTGSDQSIPSFGVDTRSPRQQPELRPGFESSLGYRPPVVEQGGRPPFVAPGPQGVQGGPYQPQQGPPTIYAPPQGRPEYNTVQPTRGNNPFDQRNPNEFGFDNSFGQFDDANSAFKDRFTSDRFSDPDGYFGDSAFTDDTTQEETNQTSNYNSNDSTDKA